MKTYQELVELARQRGYPNPEGWARLRTGAGKPGASGKRILVATYCGPKLAALCGLMRDRIADREIK